MTTETKKRAAEQVRKVHELLQELLRGAGHGKISQTEAAVGLRIGYIRRQRMRRRFDLGALLMILEHRNISPGDFFRELYPADPDEVARQDADAAQAEAAAVDDTDELPEGINPGIEGVLLGRLGLMPYDPDDTLP